MAKTIAFIGYSKSGKTTLVMELTRYFVRRDATVGVVKHTHHKLGRGSAGDSQRFIDAGAAGVVFCNEQEAIFYGSAPVQSGTRFPYDDAMELVDRLQTDLVFIEGFKQRRLAPTFLVEREGAERIENPHELTAAVTDWPAEFDVPTFRAGEIPEIAAFIDRITAP